MFCIIINDIPKLESIRVTFFGCCITNKVDAESIQPPNHRSKLALGQLVCTPDVARSSNRDAQLLLLYLIVHDQEHVYEKQGPEVDPKGFRPSRTIHPPNSVCFVLPRLLLSFHSLQTHGCTIRSRVLSARARVAQGAAAPCYTLIDFKLLCSHEIPTGPSNWRAFMSQFPHVCVSKRGNPMVGLVLRQAVRWWLSECPKARFAVGRHGVS